MDFNKIPWHISSEYLSHTDILNYYDTKKIIDKLK